MLRFDDDHELLRSSVRRFLSQRFDRSKLRAHIEAGAGFDRALFDEICALGWTAMPSWLHAVLLCEEVGRALLPLPVTASLLCAKALGVEDHQGSLAFALTESRGRFEPDAIIAHATRDDDGFHLSGHFEQVIGGDVASTILAPFRIGGDLAWFILPREATVTTDTTIDPTRPTARVAVDARVAGTARISGSDGLYRSLLRHALTLYAAEAVGAAETALSMTRDYACERMQFGKPIGSYQAVSHPIVDVMIAVEQARSLTIAAAAALDEGSDDDTLPRMANAAASEALWFAASRGVQFHGGYGFTWDCDIHFYLRRALGERGALGDPTLQRRKLADALFAD